MEKQLDFELMLPLKEIALRNVVSSFWKKTDVLVLIKNYLLSFHADFCRLCRARPGYADMEKSKIEWLTTVEGQVKGKVLELVLFKSLEEQMMLLVRPIGLQILKWYRIHKNNLGHSFKDLEIFLEQLCWTSVGTIDHLKTARKLVCLKTLHIEKRFILACVYCLEDQIQFLWRELPKKSKRFFYNKDSSRPISIHLEHYWPYVLEGKSIERTSSYKKQAFEHLCFEGNAVAAKCFFQKLSYDEKQIVLNRSSRIINRLRRLGREKELKYGYIFELVPDVVVHLLSLMSLENRKQFFQQNSLEVLICFLYWPCLDHLKDHADQIWAFFPEKNYCHLFEYILARKSILGDSFSKFLLHSPYNFKKLFVEKKNQTVSVFTGLCSDDDVEAVIKFFGFVEDDVRVRFFTCFSYFKLLNSLLLSNQLQMVKRCLQETTTSKQERETLKKSLMGFLSEDGDTLLGEWRKENFKMVFEFLDKIESDHSKRRYEDEILTSEVKRRR